MAVRQLPPNLVNRIAAGEVVERPSSVVKELIENAIDAGARRIDVAADGGGRRLIRVADDGIGMTQADLDLAVERHATSKLADDDLSSIMTLGFRGEALPSIGAVGRLAIKSRAASAREAYEIAVDAGRKSKLKPAALAAGTLVEVRDLFYATPARLKFMKSERVEAAAVSDMVKRLALARPEIAFSLTADERAAFWLDSCPPGLMDHGLARLGRIPRIGDCVEVDGARREGRRLPHARQAGGSRGALEGRDARAAEGDSDYYGDDDGDRRAHRARTQAVIEPQSLMD